MAVKTFDNDSGGGDSTWETAANWDPTGVPANGDSIVISAACTVSTDYDTDRSFAGFLGNSNLTLASGGKIHFNAGTCDTGAGMTLTLQTGCQLRFTDVAEYESNGPVSMDGGLIIFEETDNSFIQWEVKGVGVTGTTNGGEIRLVAANVNRCSVLVGTSSKIIGDSSTRIKITGATGAAVGYCLMGGLSLISYVDFDGVDEIRGPIGGEYELDNCLIHAGGNIFTPDREVMHISDCFIYGNTRGILCTVADLSLIKLVNTVFGETEAAASDDNTTADMTLIDVVLHAHNCKFSSTTPLVLITWVDAKFTDYDQDETDWREYQGVVHLAQPEFGSGAQGGSGTAVKCVTSSSAGTDVRTRFRRLVAVIPATHGDVIAATLYVKSAASGKIANLRIDPDGIYGTTQVINIDRSNTTYNQETIPNYTVSVSGGAGTKVSIPIYLDMTGASETWFYDTLDWTIS